MHQVSTKAVHLQSFAVPDVSLLRIQMVSGAYNLPMVLLGFHWALSMGVINHRLCGQQLC